MMLVHPEINAAFDFDSGCINSLIIENPAFFFQFLSDIHNQICGNSGNAVLSENNNLLPFSKNAEILDTFIPFDINKKSLLTQITNALEKNALSPEHYEQSMQVLGAVEAYLSDISFDFPCDIIFSKLSVSSLIKSSAPELRDEYGSLAEKILDYMELVNEFDRKKLFITVNLRSYLSDDQMDLFARTAISHGYCLLMLEAFEKTSFSLEKRCVIDSDLCEIS